MVKNGRKRARRAVRSDDEIEVNLSPPLQPPITPPPLPPTPATPEKEINEFDQNVQDHLNLDHLFEWNDDMLSFSLYDLNAKIIWVIEVIDIY